MSRAAIRNALAAGTRFSIRPNTLEPIIRIGNRDVPLQDGQGRMTQAGRLYQEIAVQLDIDSPIVAWRHGTGIRGRNTVGVPSGWN